jgi:hypothetical protein
MIFGLLVILRACGGDNERGTFKKQAMKNMKLLCMIILCTTTTISVLI